jgi:lipoprotein-releasing system permease protein
MGVSRAVIFRVFLLQGAIIGVFGSVVGSGLGAALSSLFSRAAQGPGGEATFPMALTPQLLGLAIFIATVTGVLAAALPARRAARLEPVEAIRHA